MSSPKAHNSVPVMQVDYYTGEEIAKYESVEAAAYDNWIEPTSLRAALRKDGKLKRRLLRFEKVTEDGQNQKSEVML